MALLCFHNAYLTAVTVILFKLCEDLSLWLFAQILCGRARIAIYVFLPDTASIKAGAIFGIKAVRVQ